MILTLIIGLILIGLEIWYDISRHKKQLNDKPQSTLIWLLLIVIFSIFLPGMYHSNVLLFMGQRFMFFDFGYNIARWKSLPIEYTWWLYNKSHLFPLKKYHGSKFKVFIEKLFYHGTEEKLSKMKWWKYDKIMSKIGFFWPMELLVKIVVFTTVFMDYYMDGSIIDWLIDLI